MNWYLAKIIYKIECTDGNYQSQFDEQYRIIEAIDALDAFKKANEIALLGEDEFLNEKKEIVHWKFSAITELNAISKPSHGIEVYSTIIESDEVHEYPKKIQMKEFMLRKRLQIPQKKIHSLI